MKKTLLFVFAALVAFASCQKEVEKTDVENPEEVTVSAPGTFIANFEDMDTKAFFTYDAVKKTYAHFWELNDKIAVFPKDDVYDEYKCTDVDNGVFALNHEASGTATSTFAKNYAVYPYDAVYEADPDAFDYTGGMIDSANERLLMDLFTNVRLEKPYGYGNVMVARSDDNKLDFKNVVGWLKISLKGDVKVRSITFNSNGGVIISGEVYVSFDADGNPVATPSEYNNRTQCWIDFEGGGVEPVQLSLDTPTDFYIPLLPCTLSSGFWINCNTSIGEQIFETTNPVTITRNKVTPMAVKTIAGPSATLKPGSQFNQAIKTLVNGSTSYYYTNNSSIKSIVLDTGSTVNTGTEVQATGSEKPVYANFDSGTGVLTLSSEATTIYANADASNMFYRFLGLTSTPAVGLNTSNVTDMSYMFYECTGLTSLDLSVYNTSNVINMSNMFDGLTLSSMDVSALNTSKVTNMSNMFSRCSNLTSLDLSGFITSEVTNMSGMFYNSTKLESINVTGWNTSNVTNMGQMFYFCSALKNLDVSGFVTSSVTNMSQMFYYCRLLQSLDVSGFNTSEVTSMNGMFYFCQTLKSLNVHGFDLTKVTTTEQMFYNCYNLTDPIQFIYTTAPVLANMKEMFLGCSGVARIDLPGTTSALTNVKGLFQGCSTLSDIRNTNNFKGRPTDISYMFKGCSSLVGITLETGFNTTDCNTYVSLFSGCTSLHNVYFYGLVVKGSGSPGLGGGEDFYAKFNNAFAGCGCRVHCVGYSSELGNTNPYNAFGTTHSSYTEGARPTFHDSASHSTAYLAGHVYFCTAHSDKINELK
jgi:surface protein